MVTYDKIVLGLVGLFLLAYAVQLLIKVVPVVALAIVALSILVYFAADTAITNFQK